MPLLPPAAEIVPFDEVAAILADAVARSTGGPPALLPIPGRYLAAALDLAGCQVVRCTRPGPQLTL